MWINAEGVTLAEGMKVRTESGSEGVIDKFHDCHYCPKSSLLFIAPGRTRGGVVVSLHTDAVTEVWVEELWTGTRFFLTINNYAKCMFITHSLERAKERVSELCPSETPIDWVGDDAVSGRVPNSLMCWVLQKTPVQ